MYVMKTIDGCTLPLKESCVALGLFDGLHIGHRAVVDAMVQAADADALTACVFTFTLGHVRPEAKLSARRLITDSIRNRILEEWGVSHLLCPDFSTIRDFDPEEFVDRVLCQRLSAKHLFCGADYRFGKGAQADAQTLRELGAKRGMKVTVLPLIESDREPVSSTRIRARLAEGEMMRVREMLGRPYTVDFEVVHGLNLAYQLGSPTINQPMPESYAYPRFGVYMTVATVDGKRYPGVTNVGVKPTVGANDRVIVETFILGYSGDLYGRRIPVEFYEFIRPEQKFPNLDALKAQIQCDTETVKGIASRINI